MIPNWTTVRLTKDVPCTSGELGDEGTVIDKIESNDKKQLYIVDLFDKEEIVTVTEECITDVNLN